ncbi:hypothetical protein, partial [Staphylococcus simulans]
FFFCPPPHPLPPLSLLPPLPMFISASIERFLLNMKKRYVIFHYLFILLTGILLLNSFFNPAQIIKISINIVLFICVLLLALIAWIVGRFKHPKQ